MPVSLAVFGGSALVYFHLYQDEITPTSAAQVLVAGCYRTFGFAATFLFLLLLFAWGSVWVFTGRIERPLQRLARASLVLLTVGVVMNLGNEAAPAAPHQGDLGAWLAGRLVGAIGYYASVVLVWPAALGSMLLATDYFFFDYLDGLRRTRGAQPEAAGAQDAAAPRPSAAAAADRGVEAEAAEHLKSLAMVRDVRPADWGAEPRPGGGASASDGEASAVDVQPAEDPVDPPTYRPWRRSYRERRQAAEAAADGQPAEAMAESWLPVAPETEEISLPEAEIPDAEIPQARHLDAEAPSPASPGAEILPKVATADAGSVTADPAAADPMASAAPNLPSPEVVVTEPTVSIPRPEPETLPAAPSRDAARQQHLFAATPDAALVDEAIEVVTTWRRASATFLQRRLRIDYAMACQLLAELAARGIVELEADASQGRVRGG
ncbi:MAG: hypothetical protein JNK49_14180 [Planctomycetes bacterium]|nr:hypothetical protein [Planctomycetota bacterium]